MKSFTVVLSLFLLILSASCKQGGDAKAGTSGVTAARTAGDAQADRVEVISFYGTHRCVSCIAMEANSQYTVETYFKDDPRVQFKTVNVDDEKNYDIAEKFEAAGTALFINVVKDGREKHIDLTDFGFTHYEDKAKFASQLRDKIKAELAQL